MFLTILLFLLGLVLLIKGANWLVNGASLLAKQYHISEMAIGLTIVAFGTSAPELVVNTIAAFQQHHDIVLGNVIGSNNFNLFLILGVTGIITPLVVKSSLVWKEIPLSLLAALVLLVLANYFDGDNMVITRMEGGILLLLFAVFLYYVYKQLGTDEVEKQDSAHDAEPLSKFKLWGSILIGLTALVVGGQLLVSNAVEIATALNVSDKVIGITIVAAGTSLPELATSLVAAFKKNNDIAVGNIIGSNIFNIGLILGLSALVEPISYNSAFNFDLYFLMIGTGLLIVAMFTGKKLKLDRWEALVLTLAFVAYTIYSIS